MLESTRKERGVRDRSQAAFVHINNTSEVSTVLKMEEGVHVGGWSLTFKQPPWRLTLNASHMIRRITSPMAPRAVLVATTLWLVSNHNQPIER